MDKRKDQRMKGNRSKEDTKEKAMYSMKYKEEWERVREDRDQYYGRRVLFAACGLVNPLRAWFSFHPSFLFPLSPHILCTPISSSVYFAHRFRSFIAVIPVKFPPWVQNLLSTSIIRFVNTNSSYKCPKRT